MTPYNKLSKEEVIKRVSITNPDVVVEGEYVRNNVGIKCYCSKCGFGKQFEWNPLPTTLFKENACPICNNKQFGGKFIKGINDLETFAKSNNLLYLLDEWDYDENLNDCNTCNSPSEIARANNNKVHWKCSVCGFKYMMSPNKRTTIDKRSNHPAGCPHCSKSGTSFPELAISFYLSKIFDIKHRCKDRIGQELDIYIPAISTAIEYDGSLYHLNKIEKDNLKDQLCKKNNIRLIRIREFPLPALNLSECLIYKYSNNYKELDKTIIALFNKINIVPKFSIDVENDYSEIIKEYKRVQKENSLLFRYPEVSEEWDYENNGTLRPENFGPGESYKASWICKKCGFHWKASIYSRTNGGHGCPHCGLKKQGYAYSESRYLEHSFKDFCINNKMEYLLNEWDYEANKMDINTPDDPSKISESSPRKVHWVCPKCGYKWVASVYDRKRGIYNCSKCNGKLLITGENDLETWCHKNNKCDILDEWDYEENRNDLKAPNVPNEIRYNSYVNVHFICKKCGNKYLKRLADRTIYNKECGICSKTTRAEKHQKKVLLVEQNKIFSSVKDAAMYVGKNSSSIVECLKGRRKTAYNFHWRYINE